MGDFLFSPKQLFIFLCQIKLAQRPLQEKMLSIQGFYLLRLFCCCCCCYYFKMSKVSAPLNHYITFSWSKEDLEFKKMSLNRKNVQNKNINIKVHTSLPCKPGGGGRTEDFLLLSKCFLVMYCVWGRDYVYTKGHVLKKIRTKE